MGYTPSYSPGDVLTAAAMNSIGEAWETQNYVAGTSWSAATTNPVIGNGTYTAKYLRLNKLMIARYKIVMGSTTTFGSGTYSLGLQTAAASAYATGDVIGQCRFVDVGGVVAWSGTCTLNGLSAVQLNIVGDGGILGPIEVALNATSPVTWQNGDILTAQVIYEV